MLQKRFVVHHKLNSFFKPSQLCKATESANGGIPGICFFVQIIQHLVSMIGAKWNCFLSLLLFVDQFAHNPRHVYITIEVICLKEISLIITLCATQMNEVNAITQAPHHSNEVIIRTHTK